MNIAIILMILIGVIASFVLLGIGPLSILFLKIELYFLKFDLKEHPILIALLEDVLKKLYDDNGIKVFQKSFEELNENEVNKEDMALAKYVYTLDVEHQKKCKNILLEVKKLEEKYGMPYNELCKSINIANTLKEDSFVLPKILLCNDTQIEKYGLLSYYSTQFHEIGHHFAITIDGNCTEEAANQWGYKLVKENLPLFFQLLPHINFRYRLDIEKLNLMKSIKAHLQFLKYLRIKNK